MNDEYDDDDDVPDLMVLEGDSPQEVDAAVAEREDTEKTEKREEPAATSKVPVTILSGFLGSGKTTLVRYILSSPDHGYRIAVIENEFGGGEGSASSLAVESMIATDGLEDSLADLIELPNGCVCCTVKDSLVETLENLLKKRSDLDYILIEASGMANPGPLMSVFWLDEALESRLTLDGVVTCVDVSNIEQQIRETAADGQEAAQQVAFADRLLLNKVDLLKGKTTKDSVVTLLRSINSSAPVQFTTYSRVPDLKWILNANCLDVDRVRADVERISNDPAHTDSSTVPLPPPAALCEECSPAPPPPPQKDNHRHTSSIGTVSLLHNGSVSLQRLHEWLATLLWPDQDERDAVLRARLEESLAKLPPETQQQQQKDDDEKKKSAITPTAETEKDNVQAKQANQSTSDPSRKPTPTMKIFRIKGILSVRHAMDKTTGSVVIHNDGVESVEKETAQVALDAVNMTTGLDSRRYIVQAVNDLWEIHPASDSLRWEDNNEMAEQPSPSTGARVCKLIVIGRSLDVAFLQRGFQGCFPPCFLPRS